MNKTVLAVLAVVLVVSSVSCKTKKKAGDKCDGDEAMCADKGTILECHEGKLAAMTCKGPKGCAERLTGATTSGRNVTHNYAVTCDFTTNAPGDACLEDEASCSADKSLMVACKDKKIVVAKCMGPKKCSESATQIDCDTSIQPAGEPCEGADDAACTPDKKQMLKCTAGKLQVAVNCRGPKGCTSTDRKIECDTGPQNVGDPCSGDGYECAADKKALLKCAAGKWIVDQKCKKTCVADAHEAGCK